MKKQTKINVSRLCLVLGAALLLVGAVVLISWQWGIHSARENAADYVRQIRSLTPAPQGALLEERSENAMAVLSIEGEDFVGLLEMPRYGSVLPVAAGWGDVSRYPCRFEGSVYDGTLCIGATSQKGQYDFYREISVGDSVCFTDMEGNQFSYRVTDIRYEDHADQAALRRKEADLVLFIKNVYAMEYILVFCSGT